MKRLIIPVVIILTLLTIGCYLITTEYNKALIRRENQEFLDSVSDKPLSDDALCYEEEAILIGADTNENKVKLLSVDNNKEYELKYDRTTNFLGKHGNSLTPGQILIGEAVRVNYSVRTNMLYSMSVSSKAWTQTGITKFEFDKKKDSLNIASDTYKIDDNLVISYGDKLVELIEIIPGDMITVKGYDRKVVSVIVEKGHGYIRLVNDPYFVGGWIEVGQEIITHITQDMLIPVPEGDYHVRLTNRGYQCDEDVTVKRDEETEIDLKKAKIEEVAIGHIKFTIDPDFAQLFVDDVITDFEDRVPLEYGIHKVHVELAGYKSVDTNLRVGGEYADVEIELELDTEDANTDESDEEESDEDEAKEDSKDSDTAQDVTPTPTLAVTLTPTLNVTTPTLPRDLGPYIQPVTTTNSTSFIPTLAIPSTITLIPTQTPSKTPTPTKAITPTEAKDVTPTGKPTESDIPKEEESKSSENKPVVIGENKKLYIDAPVGVEVYMDGRYIGIAPISCDVVKGDHSLTLQKEGYRSRSYNVNIPDEDKDVTFSFSDLIAQ